MRCRCLHECPFRSAFDTASASDSYRPLLVAVVMAAFDSVWAAQGVLGVQLTNSVVLKLSLFCSFTSWELIVISQLPDKFIGTSGKPLEYVIVFFVDPYGFLRLLTQSHLTLAALYHLKIPLQLIKIKRTKEKNAEQIDQINRSNISEGYNVIRQIWVSKWTQPYRSTKKYNCIF